MARDERRFVPAFRPQAMIDGRRRDAAGQGGVGEKEQSEAVWAAGYRDAEGRGGLVPGQRPQIVREARDEVGRRGCQVQRAALRAAGRSRFKASRIVDP